MTHVTCRLTAKNRDQLRNLIRSAVEYGLRLIGLEANFARYAARGTAFRRWIRCNPLKQYGAQCECCFSLQRQQQQQRQMQFACHWHIDTHIHSLAGSLDWWRTTQYVHCWRIHHARSQRTVVHCVSKKQDTKLLPITSPNVNRFSKFFHWQTHW